MLVPAKMADRVKSIAKQVVEGITYGGRNWQAGASPDWLLREAHDLHGRKEQHDYRARGNFGPVLCMLTYDTENEAKEIANDTVYGLAAYVPKVMFEPSRWPVGSRPEWSTSTELQKILKRHSEDTKCPGMAASGVKSRSENSLRQRLSSEKPLDPSCAGSHSPMAEMNLERKGRCTSISYRSELVRVGRAEA
jgi:hypothetical protein